MKLVIALVAAALAYAQSLPLGGIPVATGGGGGGSATFKAAIAADENDSDTSITTSQTLNLAAGDLVVCLAAGTTAATGVTIGGQPLASVSSWTASSYYASVWYLQNASADAAAAGSASFGPSTNYEAVTCANWSGAATTGGALNNSCYPAGCASLAATSTSRTATNVTTATAATLHIAVGIDWNGATHTQANGYTLRGDAAAIFLYDKNVSSTGTYPSGNFGTVTPTDQYMSYYLVFGVQ